jgi:hypothetical protein
MSLDPVYQIYTFEPQQMAGLHADRYLKWGLHTTTKHREKSLLHAKMLILDPKFTKIQVEKVFLCEKTGKKQSRTVKIIKKMQNKRLKRNFLRLYRVINAYFANL